MNYSAIQHLAFDNYCYPLDEDTMQVNIRTGKDVDRVQISAGDPFAGGIMGGNHSWKGEVYEVTEKRELQDSYWWTFTYKPPFKRLAYYFIIHSGKEKTGYAEIGFLPYEEIENGIRFGFFIFPWMNSADIIKPPLWPEKTVWYQIFPSRFEKGDNPLENRKLLPWGKPDQKVSNTDIFGGNIQGITDRIPYLSNLGITGIYTTPINLAYTEHKYDTTDYLKIDPAFGTSKSFKTMVKTAHEHGIRVMIDGVFNHSGYFFEPWQDVLKNREKSKYASWFMVNDFNFEQNAHNTAKGKYYSFAFVDFMPKLNTNNPQVIAYLLDVVRFWIKEYDIDGLRLDVANEISHKFCKELNYAAKTLKPDFFIVGEIWHNSLPWLREHEFDSVMNYPVQNAIADFFMNPSRTSAELEFALNRCLTMYYRQNQRVMFNQMDSHDTIRITNRLKSKNKALQAITALFMLPGAVCLYYGTEVLLPGEHDPDCRRCMPWEQIEKGDYKEELAFFKKLISLRKTENDLVSPDVIFEKDQNPRILHIRKGNTHFIANASNQNCKINTPEKLLLIKNYEKENLLPEGLIIYKN